VSRFGSGVYFLTYPEHPNVYLFDGGHQYDRYIKDLKRVLGKDDVAAAIASHGADPRNLATHTFRKAAVTEASSATTSGATETAIDNHAGWSRGTGSREVYMRGHSAADCCLGRFLAGLPIAKEQFAQLPPHFAPGLEIVKRAVQITFNGIEGLDEGVAEMLLASIVYHYDFLHNRLPAAHPAFSSPLFSTAGLLDELKPLVHCGCHDTDLMHATGIPADLDNP
jgi:hypothetical protein